MNLISDADFEYDDGLDDDSRRQLWFKKVAPLVNQTRKISLQLCTKPGFSLSIDEMMVRFRGRSSQTHRLKGKPISEGFKFFCISDSRTGYIHYFVPDGRVVNNSNPERNEYVSSATISKICAMILFLIARLKLVELNQQNNLNFLIAMDNYFTYPKVMSELRARNIGVLGTARNRRGWPPEQLKLSSNPTFNELVWCRDQLGTLVVRWVDNSCVLMVSTVHSPHEKILRPRKKPRQTATNKSHLDLVWNNGPIRNIHIPRIINDYNHFMGGVDLSDQLISYYTPNLRCRRTWMPMMIQCLQIMRVNAYIVFKHLTPDNLGKNAHKLFVLDIVTSMRSRASSMFSGEITTRNSTAATSNEAIHLPYARISMKNPGLPPSRLSQPFSNHIEKVVRKQRACRMCSYLRAKFIQEHGKNSPGEPKVREPGRICTLCKVHLCTHHFESYHQEGPL